MNEANDLPELPNPNDTSVEQHERGGISVQPNDRWSKQQRAAMVITGGLILAMMGITMFTRDDDIGESEAPSAVPQAPSEIKSMVPGDALPPSAQKQIEEANKERAQQAAAQGGSVMESAPPINTQSPPPAAAEPSTNDMPPPPSHGETGQQGFAFDPKMAENKLKAMQEMQARWKQPNTAKFVVVVDEKTQQQSQVQTTSFQAGQLQPPPMPQQEAPKGNHISAGATFYAQWDKSMNSDAGQSMAKATIRGGALDGATLLGKTDRKDEQLLVHFTLMSFKGHSMPVDAVAVNATTTADSVATEIDNHTFSRWLALAGASFLEGAANMAERSGQTMASTFGGPVTVATNYSTKELIAGTVGNLGRRGATIANSYFNTPPTLTTNQGDELGIIFATQTEDKIWLPKINDL